MNIITNLCVRSLQFAIITAVAVGFTVMPFGSGLTVTPEASAATTSINGESATLNADNDEYASTTDTSNLQDVEFSFDYDATKLEGTDGRGSEGTTTLMYQAGSKQDSVKIVSGDESGSSTLSGLSSSSSLDVSISADTSEFLGDDKIELTNITVSGEEADSGDQSSDGVGLDQCDGEDNSSQGGPVENTDTTEEFENIQHAIDDCDTDDGDTIKAEDGTYSENVMVRKELTLRSVNGKGSTEIEGTVTVADSNTTVGGAGVGFGITDGDGVGVDIRKTDNDSGQKIENITIRDNNIHDVGNISSGPNPGDAVGIFIQDGDSVDINRNNIHDITVDPSLVDGYDDGITEAVLIGNNSSPSNIAVRNNDISNVVGAVGAFGVNTDAVVSSLSVKNNSVSDIIANKHPNDSYKTYAVGVDFTLESDDVSVKGNTFEDFESNGTESYRPVAVDVKSGNGNNLPSVKLNNFLFTSNASSSDYGAGVEHDDPQADNVVDATKNFWNTSQGPDVDDGRSSPGAEVDPTSEVNHSPWLCNKYTGQDSPETSTDGSCDSGDGEGDDGQDKRSGDNTLRVCKVAVDSNGNIFDGNKTNSTFSLDISSATSSNGTYATTSDVSTTTTFNTALDHNDNFFDENGDQNDVQCKAINNLPDGNYFYDEEGIDSSSQWDTPQYNDGASRKPNNLNDFADYSGELTDDNPNNNSERNEKSDGDIPLEGGETRALTVKNTKDESEEPEQCTSGEQWVDEVTESDQGVKGNGDSVNEDRSATSSVLGTPDATTDPDSGFYSLGEDGTITVKFDEYVVDQQEQHDGGDISVHEVTNNRDGYVEKAEVELSEDGSMWSDPIAIDNQNPNGVSYVDMANASGANLDYVRYVRITDSTDLSNDDSGDGFDIDAVDGVYGECEKPEEEPGQCTPEATLNLEKDADNATPVTEVSLNDRTVSDSENFDLFASGDTTASATSTNSGEVRVERTSTGFKLYFSGGAETVYQFKGSIQLDDVDFAGVSTSTINGAPLEDGSSGFPDVADVDEQNSEVDFHLRVSSGDDSFVLEGLEKQCEDPGDEEPQVLACQPDTLYHMKVEQEEGSKLISIDNTGTQTNLSEYPENGSGGKFGTLAVHPDTDEFWSLQETGQPKDLVTLQDNGSTILQTTVSDIGRKVALGFAPDGSLYAGDQTEDEMLEVNPTTGATSTLGTNMPNVSGGDLSVNADGDVVYVKGSGKVYLLTGGTGSWNELDVVGGSGTGNHLDGDYTSLAYTSDSKFHAYDRPNNEVDTFRLEDTNMDSSPEAVQEDNAPSSDIQYGDGASCLAPQEDEEPTGTIEGMKFEDDSTFGEKNEGEEGLEDWKILAFGEKNLVDTLQVDSEDSSGVTTTQLQAGNEYLVTAEGDYRFSPDTDNNGNEIDFADAEYFTEDGWNSYSDVINGDEKQLELLINGQEVEWGPYNSNHEYFYLDQASSGSANFRVHEGQSSWYEDNSGTLEVKIYDVTDYTDTTDANGDYSIEVPLGEYTVIEKLQNGFEQTYPDDGQHVVSVDEDGETVTADFGNDDLEEEGEPSGGNDNPEQSGDGGGGGSTLSSSDGGDDGSVLGEQDTDGSGSYDSSDDGDGQVTDESLADMLGDLADALRSLQNSLGSQVAGDRVGFPNTGDGSLTGRLAQTGTEDVPEDIDPNENVSTSTVDPSEVSTSSGATSTDEDEATTSTDDDRTGGFGWGFWVALIGLLVVGFALYRSADDNTDDPVNQETVQ
jgi:hypothetical protein